MTDAMPIRDLFVADVTRDIPPVVYFHEQTPDKLASEVSEYIITGGWPPQHPNHRRVPNGIHEEYVHLLRAIAAELDRPGGPDLPAVWISGFYGSGKSSFAKLLGLALDGVALPDGGSLAEAWLRRDTSPLAGELREAWDALRQKIEPLAVVFDIGSVARDNEHIHAAAVRQLQRRLGYCTSMPQVAEYELRLERDGHWQRFEQVVAERLGSPWSAVKDEQMAEDKFSLAMHALFPDLYPDPMDWIDSRAGSATGAQSVEEAVKALRDMLAFRSPGSTLFLVVDEVSQYILAHKDRVDRLRAFASDLGANLRGKAWLLALGQQKLDEEADDSFLVWAKDRFPPKLRVHLAPTNIRDVVHARLLKKTPDAQALLRALFEQHRASLKLFAYGCESITAEDFVEVYPMLPGHIDLLLQITSALRARSARAQGDDQAIRGLLQLLGELFRSQGLADLDVGALVTLDRIYDVQHTALDSEVQTSMSRILAQCADDAGGLLVKAAKVVALLELIQDTTPTDARLVAQCLYDALDRGDRIGEVTEALEELRRRNLLDYSEKQGYKIQSSAGEEWARERRELRIPRENLLTRIQGALKHLLGKPERPRLQGRPFPWAAVFSDGRRVEDAVLVDPRDPGVLRVDLRYLGSDERIDSTWIRRSGESALHDRLVWVSGDIEPVDEQARELARSATMVERFKPRRESLSPARKLLLQQEENRTEELEGALRDAVAAAWMAGRMYFRGRSLVPHEQGAAFATALEAAANSVLPDLYPHFVPTQVAPAELGVLLGPELSGPSPKFLDTELGLLELDAGRYVPACGGVVPGRVLACIEAEDGLGGGALLAHFGGPPYGYTANVVKACVAGLLRGGRLRIQPEGGKEITGVRDAGARDLFEKDRDFRRATLLPAGDDDVGVKGRARICKLFEQHLGHVMDREDQAIADAVMEHFPAQARRLRDVLTRLQRLPGPAEPPPALARLGDLLEDCLRNVRQTRPTVRQVKRHLDGLGDGLHELNLYDAELTEESVQGVRALAEVRAHHLAQLRETGALPAELEQAAERVEAQLHGDRPWREIAALDPDVTAIRAAYVAERGRLLRWQEQQSEQVRARVRAREGFSTLTSEQSHSVLRPIALAATDTTEEAVAPALEALRDRFVLTLHRAEEEANERLDEVLSEGDLPLVARVQLDLRNREVNSEAELDALLEEIRSRILAQLEAGARVRLA